MTTIPEIPIDEPVELQGGAGLPEAVHSFDAESAWAIRAALAARRPLLVRGEPGAGKSQLARAAAVVLKRVFVTEALHARSEAQDLLWRFDAVARLGEAQALAAEGGSKDVRERLAPLNYLAPGPLWWVFDWSSAESQQRRANAALSCPQPPEGWQPENGAVLLIDEIDKAESDLPNGLLDTLGNGSFHVPWLNQRIGMNPNTPPPLVVITTNEERDLPAAFLRRCMVLNLGLPTGEQAFQDWLVERGRMHFGERCDAKVYIEAAQQLWRDRRDARDQGLSPPGQAEYLDILRALVELQPDPAQQGAVLARISGYALRKHPPEPA